MSNEMSVFETLNQINVSKHVKQKGKFSYLSWAWAWAELKKHYPNATYTVYKNEKGWIYHTDGKTANTEVGVTVEGLEHKVYLPIMDFKNKAMKVESVTMMEVNKAVQRGLAKAVAMHGLGLYIYAGQDLPEPPTVKKREISAFSKKIKEYIGINKDRLKAVKSVVSVFELESISDVKKEDELAFMEAVSSEMAKIESEKEVEVMKTLKLEGVKSE